MKQAIPLPTSETFRSCYSRLPDSEKRAYRLLHSANLPVPRRDLAERKSWFTQFLQQACAFSREHDEAFTRQRVLLCGIYEIGHVMAIRPVSVREILGISKSMQNSLFGQLGWRVVPKNDVPSDAFWKVLGRDLCGLDRQFVFRSRQREQDAIVYQGSHDEKEQQYARACHQIKDLKKKVAKLKRKLALLNRQRVVLAEEPVTARADQKEILEEEFNELHMQSVIEELTALSGVAPENRRYSGNLYKLSFILKTTSPKAYRVLREVLPFPSVQSINNRFADEKDELRANITVTNKAEILITDYRRRFGIDEEIPCTLSFDATSCTKTGIKLSPGGEHVFTFMMLPFNHQYPDLLVHTCPHRTGKIDGEVLQIRENLKDILEKNGCRVMFSASDGDLGVEKAHSDAFKRYETVPLGSSLEEIISHLTLLSNSLLEDWPITDLLHLMKNARSRILSGSLALTSQSKIITGQELDKILQLGPALQNRQTLYLMKDEFVLELFNLANLLTLVHSDNMTGAYFLLPFVALNLAVRHRKLSNQTRLSLIETSFQIWFDYIKNYPTTGARTQIYEKTSSEVARKTFWTKSMCVRGCNLCIGLYWAIRTYPQFLALNRIGSHPLETLFGTTRSILRGDTRWQRFLLTEVDALINMRLMKELELRPYIRRFRNIAGCTIRVGDEEVDESIPDVAQRVTNMRNLLQNGHDHVAAVDKESLIWNLTILGEALRDLGDIEKIIRSGPTSGAAILSRYFASCPHKYKENGMDHEFDLQRLADE